MLIACTTTVAPEPTRQPLSTATPTSSPATPTSLPQEAAKPEEEAEEKTAVFPTTTPTQSYLPIISTLPNYYVSKHGNNQDGLTWETAWNELDQINWNIINPGQTIYIDGGTTTMTYTTPLHPQRHGTPTKPITITLADEPNRDGQAIIFGGRTTPLPHCGQTTYNYETENVRNTGLIFENAAWTILDGRKWGGITIHGHNGRGVRFYGSSHHITIRNLEIYDNGSAAPNAQGEWRPNMPGIGLAGHHITLERMLIHDNGQDAIQSMSGNNSLANITIRQSWLYNGRRHPTVNESFNHCRHSDGLQIFDGGLISDITIEESIIGPGLTQGIILGQTNNGVGSQATVNNVTLRHTIFTKAKGLNIMGYPDIKSQGWTIDHVTAHCPTGYTGVCLWLEGSNHTITNSIFSGSQFVLPDGLDTFSSNCQWETTGFTLGQNTNPLFTNSNNQDPFSLDNYALLANSPCQGNGSHITSVSQLLNMP